MRKPYAKLLIYTALINTSGFKEGEFMKHLPRNKDMCEREISRKKDANWAIDRHISYGMIHFCINSFVNNLNGAKELTDFVLDSFSGAKDKRILIDYYHGQLKYETKLFIPSYSKRKINDLVKKLLNCPYQPEISETAQAVSIVTNTPIDETKERIISWKNALVFVE